MNGEARNTTSRRLRRVIVAALLWAGSAVPPALAQNGREALTRQPVAAAAHDGAVMVVFLREIVFDADMSGISDEERIVRCITDGIRTRLPHRRMVSFDEFSAVAFPNLAPKARPRRPGYLGILLADSGFRRRIAPLGIRHVVFIGGVTETKAPRGGIVCGYGIRAAGCLGVLTWDKRSELAASIVDLASAAPARELKAEARGTAWLAIIGIVPLGMVALTESSACAEMGRRVADALPQEGK